MAQTRRLVFTLFVGAALAACSGGGSSGPTINSFTATPTNLPAGRGSVSLAWSVTGATSLSIDQSVGAVTPVNTGSTPVNITTTTTFTLSATGSSGTSTKTAQVTVAAGPATITVAGTVINDNGAGVPGQTVLITSGTFSQSVVSDSAGAFSVPNVPTPYTATVIDSGGKEAIVYMGLTRTDPTVTDLAASNPVPHSASYAGQFTGGSYPEGGDLSTGIAFDSPQVSQNITDPGDGTFSSTLQWAGPTTTTGVFYALQIHTVAGLPADFPGYGSVSLGLTDGESLTGQSVALAAVTAGTMSGTISAPAGYPITAKEASLVPTGARTPLSFLQDSTATASFSYTTPSIPNTSIFFEVEVQGTAGDATILKKTLSATATGVAITVPAPPSLSLPSDTGTGITVTTPFSWTAYPGIFLLLISPTGTGPEFIVITSETTATIPDLSTAGIPLPTSAGYRWLVIGVGPGTTVDTAAVPLGLLELLDLSDGYFSETADRTFTTGP